MSTGMSELRPPEADQYQQYRTLSFLAVVSLVFGVISIPCAVAASLNPFLLIFPFIGLLIGFMAVLKLRNRTDEFTGLGLAKAGLMLSTVLLLLGTGYASYVYATEVPAGFTRLRFSELQPVVTFPRPWSPKAEEMIGKNVFVQGYLYPGKQRKGIKQFILVPDLGTCCFGGQPKVTDMIQITLDDPKRVDYSMSRRNLAGEFKLGEVQAEKVGNVIYHLSASYVK